MKKLSPDQKLKLIEDLEERQVPFRQFWNLSDIYFTDTIKTACVQFHGDKVQMLFNEDFWNLLPYVGQLFVICHEQMHLLFNHFRRLRFEEGDVRLKNIAADVSVNHFLIRNYDFDKTDLPNWEKYCWVDTVFPKEDISDNETALYYYTLLKTRQEGGIPCPLAGLVDEHSSSEIPPDLMKKFSDMLNDFINEQTEGMSDDEKEKWLEELDSEIEDVMFNYDTTGFGHGKQTHYIKVSPDNNWKSVYKNIPKRLFKIKNSTHWLTKPRNHMLLPPDLMLPSTFETHEVDVVRVHVYLDSSGSCVNHAKRFLESSLTLPKKMFKVTIFGFGTKVYEIDTKPPYNLKGFGNESYQAVSDHVDQFMKQIDAVLVFTDGYSKSPSIKQPDKWHWFITPSGSTNMIPSGCHTYELEKLHWTGS